MNEQSNIPGDGAAANRKSPGIPKCEDIRPLVTAYMTHELGDSQSALVREHLRLCPACQAAGREIQQALDLLATDKTRLALPDRLSDKRRARIRRAYTHPLISWIETHHVAFSIIIAAVVLAAVFGILALVNFLTRETPEELIQISWVTRETVKLDELPPEEFQVSAPEAILTDRQKEPGSTPQAPSALEQITPAMPRLPGETEQTAAPRCFFPREQLRSIAALAAALLLVLALAVARAKRKTGGRREEADDGVTGDGPAPFE